MFRFEMSSQFRSNFLPNVTSIFSMFSQNIAIPHYSYHSECDSTKKEIPSSKSNMYQFTKRTYV